MSFYNNIFFGGYENFFLFIPTLLSLYFISKRKINIIIIQLNFLLITIVFFFSINNYLFSIFSNNNIKFHSNILQSVFYKLCAFWSNHDGSLFLWCWLFHLLLYIFILILCKWNFITSENNFIEKTIFNLQIINIVQNFFIIYIGNPYIYTKIFVFSGKELNPILQDITLAIHPPFLYLGYIAPVISFCLALSFLQQKTVTSLIILQFNKLSIIFSKISWTFLTFGIFLGSWWAYYELGWGGWWFWDPVENIAIIPWLLNLLFFHLLCYKKYSVTLLFYSIVLALLCYYSSILGTIFVRSGYLNSIHSFVIDGSSLKNNVLLLLLFLVTCIVIHSLYIISIKLKLYKKAKEEKFSIISKNFSFFGGLFNIFFSVMIILIGTYGPTIYSFFLKKNMTIGPYFYNVLLYPIVLISIIFLILFKSTSWNFTRIINIKNYLFFFFGINVLIFPLIFFLMSFCFLNKILFFLSINALLLFVFTKKKDSFFSNLGHFVYILFIIILIIYQENRFEFSVYLQPSNFVYINNYLCIFYNNFNNFASNYNNLISTFYLFNIEEAKPIFTIYPEKRYYFASKLLLTKMDIISTDLFDICVSIGKITSESYYFFKFIYNPGILFIWICFLLLFFLGLFSIHKKIKNINLAVV